MVTSPCGGGDAAGQGSRDLYPDAALCRGEEEPYHPLPRRIQGGNWCSPGPERPPERAGPGPERPPERAGPGPERPPERAGPGPERPPERAGPGPERPPEARPVG